MTNPVPVCTDPQCDCAGPTNAEVLAAVQLIDEKIQKALDAILLVEGQVKPMIDSLANSPIMKMFGGKAK